MLYESNDIGISSWENFLCRLIRIIRGSNKCINLISKLSKMKYGYRDDLRRYWYAKYKNINIGKDTYGYENIKHSRIKSIGSFCSIASEQIIVPNAHRMDWVSTSPILAVKDFDVCEKI